MDFAAADSLAMQIEHNVRDRVRQGLSEYCAATTIEYLIHDSPDLYFESPMNKHLLGVTLVDDDVTVTVNSNIWYKPRKIFTQAHELCHVLLDKNYLRKNPHCDLSSAEGMINDSDLPHEHQANHFAATVILPDEVLRADMLEQRSAKWIRHTQCASLPTIQYRLEGYLKEFFLISKPFAVEIAKHFAQESPDNRWISAISLLWRSVKLTSIDQLTVSEIKDYNDHLCDSLITPLIAETKFPFDQVFRF